MSRVHN